jgi:hypothetical protein
VSVANWDFRTVKDDFVITVPFTLPLNAEDASVDVNTGERIITVNIWNGSRKLLESIGLQFRPLAASYILERQVVMVQFRLGVSGAFIPLIAKVSGTA